MRYYLGSCMICLFLGGCETQPPSFSFEVIQTYGVLEQTEDSLSQPAHVREAAGAVLGQVRGVVQTPDSSVYVLDRGWRKIVAFRPDGSLKDVFLGGQGEGPGEFQNPVHMALTPNGELAVLDYRLLRISYFNPVTGFTRIARTEVSNALRLFPIGDRIWLTTNTLEPGETGPRAIAVNEDGQRMADGPEPVAAEIPFGGVVLLGISPDSMLLLPHNRPGLWEVFDGQTVQTQTRGHELLPELQPPVVIRDGLNITINSPMLGKTAVRPIGISSFRSGHVVFWYWTMDYDDDEEPLPDTRATIAEVFTADGQYLSRANLTPRWAGHIT